MEKILKLCKLYGVELRIQSNPTNREDIELYASIYKGNTTYRCLIVLNIFNLESLYDSAEDYIIKRITEELGLNQDLLEDYYEYSTL